MPDFKEWKEGYKTASFSSFIRCFGPECTTNDENEAVLSDGVLQNRYNVS